MTVENKIFTESALSDQVKNFFRLFESGKYVDRVHQMIGSTITIDVLDVFNYEQNKKNESQLFEIVTKTPKTFLEATIRAVKEIYSEKFGLEKSDLLDLQIRITGCQNEISINDAIRHRHRNILVKVQGLVNGATDIRTRVIEGIWFCSSGHKTVTTKDNMSTHHALTKCSEPKCTDRKFILDNESSKTESYRRYYLIDPDRDERNDNLIAEAKGSYVNTIRQSDPVELTGYITFESGKDKTLHNVFHILHEKKLKEISFELTTSEKEIFNEYPKKEDFLDTLVESVAPQLHGNQLVKKAFILSYVGATKWADSQRYWTHTLVVGDPAQAKTMTLIWGTKHLPNVKIATVGATAKGLFAGQKKQADGETIMELGDMVRLDNKGLLGIDEFLLMEEVFAIMKHPMDSGVFPSQTVGGHADLPCRTPIFATANPYNKGYWNPNQTLQENLHVIDYALLSRFDLIIIVRAKKDHEEQMKVARKILGQQDGEMHLFNEEDTAKFLVYAKSMKPVLSDESKDAIVESIGNIFKDKAKHLADNEGLDLGEINERLIGTLIRLSISYAKLHLRQTVSIQDVILAKILLQEMFDQRGFKIGGGVTLIERVGEMIFGILKKFNGRPMDYEEISTELVRTQPADDEAFNQMISKRFHPSENRQWRNVMEYVEHSGLVEVTKKKNPRTIRWKTDSKQTTVC
jgi:DNA replicative helicase MCM subunit Mcm2 (Cdc46/Mcm family)